MARDVETCQYTIDLLRLPGGELNQLAVLHHAIRPCGSWNGYDDAEVSRVGVFSDPGQRDLRSGDTFGFGKSLDLVNKLQVLVEVLSIYSSISHCSPVRMQSHFPRSKVTAAHLGLETTDHVAEVSLWNILELLDGSTQEAVAERSVGQQGDVAILGRRGHAVAEHLGAPQRELDLGVLDRGDCRCAPECLSPHFGQANRTDLACDNSED